MFIPHAADSFDLIALYEKISSVCGNESIVPPGTDVIFRFVAMTGFSANTEHNPLHHMGQLHRAILVILIMRYAQSEIRLHREYNLAMKNKSLSYTMLHWSIVTHA